MNKKCGSHQYISSSQPNRYTHQKPLFAPMLGKRHGTITYSKYSKIRVKVFKDYFTCKLFFPRGCTSLYASESTNIYHLADSLKDKLIPRKRGTKTCWYKSSPRKVIFDSIFLLLYSY